MDLERLGRIDALLRGHVDAGRIAGFVSLVCRRDQIVHFERFGMADIAAGRPMARDTIFRIYSMTKPITSVAALMLLEEGALRLADPVARYIPAFGDAKVLVGDALENAARPITVRDLLTHTSGLSYGFDPNDPVDARYQTMYAHLHASDPNPTLEAQILGLAALPLAHQPGTRFRYSVATDVLGYLVQVISGKPFADFLAERIFAPLGMVDTGFTVPAQKRDRFAALYGPAEGGGLKVTDPIGGFRYEAPVNAPSGGGGLASTAGDYLRFARMLANGGAVDGVRLLGRKTIELMTLDHLPAGVHTFDNPSSGFGLGVSVVRDVAMSQRLGSVGTFGWGGAASTDFWVDPQEELIGILMLQYMPFGPYNVLDDFRTLVYAALVDRPR